MLKLYNRIDGTLRYHEAWVNGRTVYEHWGFVGEQGETKNHRLSKAKTNEDAIVDVLSSALDVGYRPIALADHAVLMIEYAIDGFGSPEDVDKRHALEDRMNETLGWTGLGACDGGSIGSGSMEVCCYVVDFDIAKRVVENDLAGTEYSDFTCIYNEAGNERHRGLLAKNCPLVANRMAS